MAKETHRGSVKQQNKPHKHGRHRTKGQLDTASQGRVNVKTATKNRKKGADNHAARRNLAKQLRTQKRDKFIAKRRERGGQHSPPHFVVVVGLSAGSECREVLEQLKESVETMEGGIVNSNSQNILHVSIARFKQRLSFYVPPLHNLRAVLDAAKVADTVLFVLPVEGPIDEEGQFCLKCLQSQGMPSSFFVCKGLGDLPHKKMVEARKHVNKEIETFFPGEDKKIQALDSESDRLTTIRKLTEGKTKPVHFREIRPHLIAEKMSFERENAEALEGTLKVSGYLRGADMSADRLVHITGWGTYQISQIVSSLDPHPLVLSKQREEKLSTDVEMEGGTEVLATPDPKTQEPLQFEFQVNMFDNEDQTWPSKEELAEAEEEARQKAKAEKLRKKFLAQGLSDYQATWLLADDVNEEDEEENGSEDDEVGGDGEQMAVQGDDDDSDGWESMEEGDDSKSVALTEPDPDEKYDAEAEMQQLRELEEERSQNRHPDEVEIDADVRARERFARYRGLASFRTSPWNKDEELPIDYQRIVRVGDTKRLKNRIMKMDLSNSAMVGQYLTVYIKGVPKDFAEKYNSENPLVVFGLLPFEQRTSIVHFLVTKDAEFSEAIKSKAQLTFQVGFRRFTASALLSTHTNGDKQLMLRHLPDEGPAVMSVYGPITFGPVPVLVFKTDEDGKEQLAATGSLLSVDPDRLIIKRIILRGHQFKMGKRKGVVRFMFFNREDIEYFKKVELRTKLKRRGRIVEPLGTHGHMKCFFTGQPKSQDVVFMYLYKRVFPKWTYEAEVPFMTQGEGAEGEGLAYEIFD